MKEKVSYSKIVLGVSEWDTLKKGQIIELLDLCIEHNITSFDHADFFGNKYAGHVFGTALSETGFSREEIQLISKYCPSENPGTSLVKSVEDNLRRLKTDYLDLLLLGPSRNIPEIMKEVAQLSSQGKIREIGGLDLKKEQMDSLEKYVSVRANQLKFASDFSKVENKLVGVDSEEITPLIWYYPGADSVEKKENLEKIGLKYKCSKNQIILAWLLKHPKNLHPVLHFLDPDKILEAATLKRIVLDSVDLQKIHVLLT